MDKLDKLTIFITVVMIIYAAGLLARANGTSQAEQQVSVQKTNQVIVNPVLDKEIEVAKNLLIQENLVKSEELVNTLIKEHPYEGKLFMLKGDILMRHQKPIAAMYEYKEAISLNPDFLDKKTRLFQGKKIKITVEEAMAAIESGLKENPGDGKLKDDRQIVYFMKRKLAGSCG